MKKLILFIIGVIVTFNYAFCQTNIESNGKLSLIHNSSGVLGDLISLYGNRFQLNNMYGFGIEPTTGGVMYSRAVSGFNWYINHTADNGVSSAMSLKSNGYLGIGTNTPNGKLSISSGNGGGIVTIIDTEPNEITANPYISFYHGNDPSNLSRLGYVGYGSTGNNDLYLTNDKGGLKLRDNTGEVIYIKGGNVGIGTNLSSNPNNYKLAVKGTIGAKEIKVEINSSTWSDFVFSDDYKLRSIKDVENYINKERHLPDIPTAKEVEKNGVNIGEMNAKLLQKVEEMTLYIIDLQKQVDDLKNQLNTKQ